MRVNVLSKKYLVLLDPVHDMENEVGRKRVFLERVEEILNLLVVDICGLRMHGFRLVEVERVVDDEPQAGRRAHLQLLALCIVLLGKRILHERIVLPGDFEAVLPAGALGKVCLQRSLQLLHELEELVERELLRLLACRGEVTAAIEDDDGRICEPDLAALEDDALPAARDVERSEVEFALNEEPFSDFVGPVAQTLRDPEREHEGMCSHAVRSDLREVQIPRGRSTNWVGLVTTYLGCFLNFFWWLTEHFPDAITELANGARSLQLVEMVLQSGF